MRGREWINSIFILLNSALQSKIDLGWQQSAWSMFITEYNFFEIYISFHRWHKQKICHSKRIYYKRFYSFSIFYRARSQKQKFVTWSFSKRNRDCSFNTIVFLSCNNNLLQFILFYFIKDFVLEILINYNSCTIASLIFGVHHSVISNLWKQLQTTHTVIQRSVALHPRVTTPAEDRYIVILTKRNRRATSIHLTSMVTASIGKEISATTVLRRLRKSGLSSFYFSIRPIKRGTIKAVPGTCQLDCVWLGQCLV